MDNLFYIALAPWLVFCVFAFLARLLIYFAKKHRGIAVAFGVFVQMFLPDPLIEKTVKSVTLEQRVQRESPKTDLNDEKNSQR